MSYRYLRSPLALCFRLTPTGPKGRPPQALRITTDASRHILISSMHLQSYDTTSPLSVWNLSHGRFLALMIASSSSSEAVSTSWQLPNAPPAKSECHSNSKSQPQGQHGQWPTGGSVGCRLPTKACLDQPTIWIMWCFIPHLNHRSSNCAATARAACSFTSLVNVARPANGLDDALLGCSPGGTTIIDALRSTSDEFLHGAGHDLGGGGRR